MKENKYSNGTRYFVDNVHYKRTLGDIMLTNIYVDQINNVWYNSNERGSQIDAVQ
jgi:hypothetical protein